MVGPHKGGHDLAGWYIGTCRIVLLQTIWLHHLDRLFSISPPLLDPWLTSHEQQATSFENSVTAVKQATMVEDIFFEMIFRL